MENYRLVLISICHTRIYDNEKLYESTLTYFTYVSIISKFKHEPQIYTVEQQKAGNLQIKINT